MVFWPFIVAVGRRGNQLDIKTCQCNFSLTAGLVCKVLSRTSNTRNNGTENYPFKILN